MRRRQKNSEYLESDLISEKDKMTKRRQLYDDYVTLLFIFIILILNFSFYVYVEDL